MLKRLEVLPKITFKGVCNVFDSTFTQSIFNGSVFSKNGFRKFTYQVFLKTRNTISFQY